MTLVKLESEKRLADAIGGPKPDRVPTAPCIYFFSGHYAGFSTAELVNDPRNYRMAMDCCWPLRL